MSFLSSKSTKSSQDSNSSAADTTSSSSSQDNTSTATAPSMLVPPLSTARLSPQHERLILELLPFKDSVKFQEWLNSSFVRGSWIEFCQDYLMKTASPVEPDKTKTALAAKDAIQGRSPRLVVYHPDKTGWTAEDHHVRFIVTVILDNMLNKVWSESDWKKKPVEITKAVYEVLCFMKPSVYVDPSPPSYSQ